MPSNAPAGRGVVLTLSHRVSVEGPVLFDSFLPVIIFWPVLRCAMSFSFGTLHACRRPLQAQVVWGFGSKGAARGVIYAEASRIPSLAPMGWTTAGSYGADKVFAASAQAYLLLGDEAHLDMFAQLYCAAMRHLRPANSPGWPAERGWLGEVHMHSGAVTRPWISSLAAFWPGLQALIGAPRHVF